MHPEIEKFWTHSGYYVETDVLLPYDNDPYIVFWFLMKNGNQLRCVGKSDYFDRNSEAYKQLIGYPPCLIYFFNTQKYSEAEMLKIIKLKAFI